MQHNAPRQTALQWLECAVVAVAAAWTLVHLIVSPGQLVSDDYWGWGLLGLFVVALIIAFVRYAGERASLASRSTAGEAFPEPSVARFFQGSRASAPLWFVLRMNVGATWLLAGWDKITSPAWGTSGTALHGFVAGALAKSGGANPDVQGWYAWFLQHVVLNGAGFFSFVISYGEVLVGLGVLLGILTGVAAGFGVLMNLNYVLAGTVSINPVLGVFGIFLILAWRVCGWVGGDRWLLPALGLPWKPGAVFHRHHHHPSAARS